MSTPIPITLPHGNRRSVLLSGFSLRFIGIISNAYTLKQESKSKYRDFAVNAFRVVEQAIGEHMDGTPLPDPDAEKNPAAVALGKLGELKARKAGAAKLSPAKRKAIGKKAAQSRWKKERR